MDANNKENSNNIYQEKEISDTEVDCGKAEVEINKDNEDLENLSSETLEDGEEFKIIKTGERANDGQVKCPKCGATEIGSNIKSGKLRCYFCRHEFTPEKVDDVDIATLEGVNIYEAAQNISDDSGDVLTLKCESCGAEVIIDTASSTQARCHWCRNTLSLNSVIPNGAVPDVILPFKITKEEAEAKIAKFVNDRKFFAHPTFTKEFTTVNICGVYFPYMLVDVNAHMRLSGVGEIETDRYMVTVDEDKKEERYDADVYKVERDFDIMIDDLTIESNVDKLKYGDSNKTTNIINSILPFDTKNCVRYDSNYLRGFTSEKRDTNINILRKITKVQAADVARMSVNKNIAYDRGIRWKKENFEIKGESWKASYLPVWIYSYMQKKGDKTLLHYVAVNGRTAETMGSVPINKIKLILISILVEIAAILAAVYISMTNTSKEDAGYEWVLIVCGFVFYYYMYTRYRNYDARHTYEAETKYKTSNMVKVDEFLRSRYNLKNKTLDGANNYEIYGTNIDIEDLL